MTAFKSKSLPLVQKGFTLIEMMIAMVILSLLVGFAVESFKDNSADVKRKAIMNMLYSISQLQEQYFKTYNSYANNFSQLYEGAATGNSDTTQTFEGNSYSLTGKNNCDGTANSPCSGYWVEGSVDIIDSYCTKLKIDESNDKWAVTIETNNAFANTNAVVNECFH